MIPEIRVGEEAMRRLWLVEVGVEGVVVPVPVLDSEVLTAGAREASPNPGRQRKAGVNGVRPAHPAPFSHDPLPCPRASLQTAGSQNGDPPIPRAPPVLLGAADARVGTCDGAGGRPSVQGHVGLGDSLRVQARDLLQLGEGHDGLAAFGGRGGHQEGLLGGHGGGGQVWGPDLFCHQLLLDFVDQDEVVQLPGEQGREKVKGEGARAPRCTPTRPPLPTSPRPSALPPPQKPIPRHGAVGGLTWLGMAGGGGQK